MGMSLKVGDYVSQTLDGFENEDTFLVLEIVSESEDVYDLIVFCSDVPAGVFSEKIDKEHLENGGVYVSGTGRKLKTRIW